MSHPQQFLPELLTDGYIANMFGPHDANAHHSTLLRRGAGPLQAYSPPGYPRTFLAVPSPRPGLNPLTPWVVDRAVEDMGTVIPQRLWVPRQQREFLGPPIFFFGTGGLGLPLNQAADGTMSLHGASHPAPLGATCSTHAQIRINWCGYSGWDDQIMIRAQTHGQEIVPLGRFVMHVARKVHKFMTRIAVDQPYNNNGDQRWLIGPVGIAPEHIVLIGVVQVSQGSWMPILQLTYFAL